MKTVIKTEIADALAALGLRSDGFAADRSKWFLSEQAESAT